MNKYAGSCLLLFVNFFKFYWSIFFCHPIDVPLMYHKKQQLLFAQGGCLENKTSQIRS